MFSQVCHRGGVSLVQGSFRGYQGVGTHPPQGWVCLGGGYSTPSHTLDTTGCDQKAGGTHPTGMLSCFVLFF